MVDEMRVSTSPFQGSGSESEMLHHAIHRDRETRQDDGCDQAIELFASPQVADDHREDRDVGKIGVGALQTVI